MREGYKFIWRTRRKDKIATVTQVTVTNGVPTVWFTFDGSYEISTTLNNKRIVRMEELI